MKEGRSRLEGGIKEFVDSVLYLSVSFIKKDGLMKKFDERNK